MICVCVFLQVPFWYKFLCDEDFVNYFFLVPHFSIIWNVGCYILHLWEISVSLFRIDNDCDFKEKEWRKEV